MTYVGNIPPMITKVRFSLSYLGMSRGYAMATIPVSHTDIERWLKERVITPPEMGAYQERLADVPSKAGQPCRTCFRPAEHCWIAGELDDVAFARHHDETATAAVVVGEAVRDSSGRTAFAGNIKTEEIDYPDAHRDFHVTSGYVHQPVVSQGGGRDLLLALPYSIRPYAYFATVLYHIIGQKGIECIGTVTGYGGPYKNRLEEALNNIVLAMGRMRKEIFRMLGIWSPY
ncbi:hypothetical protein H4582DRAFT_2060441 [Lactarius indigo]|nr:hypothetical protein H4582DRAFT_2060441 [Lactarius indigo]